MKKLPALVSLVVLLVAAWVLARELAAVDAAQVARYFASIPLSAALLAVAFTLGALMTLALYETQMLRELRPISGWRRAVLAALIAYPVGHVVGFGAFSGGAVRYRVYAPAGLRVGELPRLMLLSVMPYAMALGILAAIILLFANNQVAPIFRIGTTMAMLIGAASLALHLGWIALVIRRKSSIGFLRWKVDLPGARLTAWQYLLGVAEIACASSVLYFLLPAGAAPDYVSFIAIYVAAVSAGALSGVPAGLGVFESVLLLTLPGVSEAQLLGAVLAYRLVYQLVPLGFALVLLLAFEAWTPRKN